METLPLDLIKLIGFHLDWQTLHETYRFLTRRYHRACRDDFWRQKLLQDSGQVALINDTFYPNYFFHYLAERSRYLIVIGNRFSQLPKAERKRIDLRTWDMIHRIELTRIQSILISYLTARHSNSFKTHLLDLQTFKLNIKQDLIKMKVEPNHLLMDDSPVIGVSTELCLFKSQFCFVLGSNFDKVESLENSLDKNPPRSFYNFIWSLGISLQSANNLYQIRDSTLSAKGPYKYTNQVYLPNVVKSGPITEIEIKRYFGSKGSYQKFLKSNLNQLFD